MKKMMFAAIALMMFAAAQAQESYPTVQPYENYIQVTGRADREVTPDEIYVRIVINENNTKGKISVEKQERDMVATLTKMGVDIEKQLKVDDMSSNFKDYWLKKKALTTKSYQLKLADAVSVGNAMQALEQIGISDSDVVRVAHSKIKEFQAETRAEAVKNAQQQAQLLASAIGQKAGRAIFIADYNNNGNDGVYPVTRAMYAGALKMNDAAGVPEQGANIEFRTIKISYSIQAKFELK